MGYDRYAYVNNSPLMYTDPSGHISFLATAAIGAFVGFTANYAAQIIVHLEEGKSFPEAVSWGSMDKGALIASTVGGTVAGLTMGATVLFAARIGLTAGAASVMSGSIGGALSSVAGGQAEALTRVAYDQVAKNTTLMVTTDNRHLIQFSPNGDQFMTDAQRYGFGNINKMGDDAVVGAITGLGAAGGRGLASLFGAADDLVLYAKPASWVGPVSRGIDYLIDGFYPEYIDESEKSRSQKLFSSSRNICK